MDDLKDKVVLITGASTGIGAAAARGFAAAGAHVAVHRHSSEDAAQQVAADVRAAGSQALQVRRVVSDTVAHFGRLDVLVNGGQYMP